MIQQLSAADAAAATAQITAWLDRHPEIKLDALTETAAAKCAAAYHAAITADHLKALEIDWTRDNPTPHQRKLARHAARRAALAPIAAEVARKIAATPIVISEMH